MLQLNHVRKHFGQLAAIDDLSLEIREGEIVGLVGENGAGKTTLMRVDEDLTPTSAPNSPGFPMASLPARRPPLAARRPGPRRSGEQLHPLERAAHPDGRQ